MIAARVTNDGELKVSGTLDTRMSLVTDGLVAYFPMDGTVKGTAKNNILNYNTWVIGSTGSQPGFSQNGDGNSIINGLDPFGERVPVWRDLGNDSDSNADGGWDSGSFSVDKTKLYRFSVWIKRKVRGNGSYYLGTHGYGSTNGVYTGASGGSLTTNPYFKSEGWGFQTEKWYLFVGHVHPNSNTGGTHTDTGVYETFSTDKVAGASDFRWHDSTTSSNHRSYLYYSTDAATDQQWCYPRVDICDGTEPTIADLVNGEGNVLNPNGTKIRYVRDWIDGSTSNTGNHWIELSVYNQQNINVALGIAPTSNQSLSNGARLTDGNLATNPYVSGKDSTLQYVQLDLVGLHDIKKVNVIHYYQDGRTYHHTKTEVSEDGVNWYAIYDSAIQGEYADTSSAGHTFYIHEGYSNAVTEYGVAPQKSMINYAGNGVGGRNARNITDWSGVETYGLSDEINRQTIKWDSSSGDYTHTVDEVLDDDLSTLSEKVVTCSLMLRRVEGAATGRIRLYDSVNGYRYKSVDVTREFQKFTITGTIGKDPTRIFFMIDNTGGGTYEWYDLQIETHGYATDYVKENTHQCGYAIANPVRTGVYTVAFWYKPSTTIGSTVGGYSSIMSMGRYATNNSWTLMDKGNATINGAMGFIRKGNGGEWDWSSGDVINASEYGGWNHIVVVRDSSNYRVYGNGTYRGSVAHSSTTMQDLIWVGSRENGNNGDSTAIQNLAIYNRVLTDAEITKLAKGTHSVTKEGLVTHSINSTPKPISSSSTMFPLDYDGKSLHKTMLPTKDENTVYGNGVWIGRGTTNVYQYGTFESLSIGSSANFSNQLGTSGYLGVSTEKAFKQKSLKVIKGTDSSGRIYTTTGGSTDDYFSVSALVYSENPGAHLHIEANGGDYSWSIPHSSNTHTGKGWELLTAYITDKLTSDTTLYAMYYPSSANQLIATYIDNLQLEISRYPTPFTPVSRGQSSLHLPYSIVDCKQDFTIYGWWYPKAYADGVYRPCLTRNIPDGNSTGHRILIMGNGTSSRQLRCWFGSDGNENSVYVATNVTVRDNEWNFFCLRRTSDTISLSLGNSLGFQTNTSSDGAKLNTDETGQVWQIGEYSNSESDAYHRDYVFYQGSSSTSEVQEIFNTKMKATKDGLTLQQCVSSNVVL